MRLLSSLAPADLAGKRVVVRASLNVPIKNGDAKQKFRIAAMRRTVDYLMNAGAQVALLGHLGRPGGQVNDELTLAQLADDVTLALERPVVFVDACTGPLVSEMREGTDASAVLLLENVRFDAREESDDAIERATYAQEIAANFDLFVNDAFDVCHRANASVTELAAGLPSYVGLQIEDEIATLTRVKDAPEHPAVAVVGGAKIETKLPFIRTLEPHYDAVLVGGKVANEALDEKIGFSERVMLPTDFVGERFDIGHETTEQFVAQIMGAKTVVWNGPMGWYEKDAYAHGTEEIVHALERTEAFTVVGGGESIEALEHYGKLSGINFVSAGGGSMMAFMAGDELPGIAALGG